jgi:hypothetical protein
MLDEWIGVAWKNIDTDMVTVKYVDMARFFC